MNTGAFFAVEPIQLHWNHIFSLSSFFIALGISVVIFCILFFLSFKKKHSYKQEQGNNYHISHKNESYIFPEIDDANFCNKIFLFMQQFAYNNYIPKNSFAHTFSDIAKYCNNNNFLDLYKKIELSVFQKTVPSKEEKQQYLNDIKNFIANNSNKGYK